MTVIRIRREGRKGNARRVGCVASKSVDEVEDVDLYSCTVEQNNCNEAWSFAYDSRASPRCCSESSLKHLTLKWSVCPSVDKIHAVVATATILLRILIERTEREGSSETKAGPR